MIKKIFFKTFNVGTILLWLVMMFLLVDSQIYPITKPQSFIAYKYFLPKELLLRDHWMGIYFNDKKVGYSNTIINAYEEKNFSGYQISNEMELLIFLLGEYQRVFFKGKTMIDINYNLKNFKFDMKIGPQIMKIEGYAEGRNLIKIKATTKEGVMLKEIMIPKDVFIANILTPIEFLGKLSVGKSFVIDVFEPFTLSVEKVKLFVREKVGFAYRGDIVPAYVVEVDYKGLKLKSWVSEDGHILREETPLGWIMVKEPMEEAIVYQRYLTKTPEDLISLISILPEGKPGISNSTSYMRVELEGLEHSLFSLSDERQNIISEEPLRLEINRRIVSKDALELPIGDEGLDEFLMPERLIQSEDERIKQLAGDIIKGHTNSFICAKKIKEWLFKNITKRPIIGIPSALDTLDRKVGDCNEHSFLFAALARAAGIPTKVCYGLVYINGRFFYHAWCKVYVGEWISIDPTLGQDFADATHIEIISGGLDKQIEIVRLLGKLKIKILEHR